MKKIKIRHFHPNTPKRDKKIRWKLWFAIILLAICAGSIIYVVNLPSYQIKNIEIKGAILTDESKVKEIAERNIAGSYFFVIPKSFIWSFPKSKIKSEIRALLSVLDADVRVDRKSNILNIALTERPQKYLWCQPVGEADLAGNPQCYYMDDKGLVFIQSPPLEGNIFVVFSGLIAGDPVGQSFLPEEKMAELVSFMNGALDLGFAVKSVNAVSLSEIRLALKSGTEIIISSEKSLSGILANLQILKDSPEFVAASGGIENLQYIDLRYGTKAFWK